MGDSNENSSTPMDWDRYEAISATIDDALDRYRLSLPYATRRALARTLYENVARGDGDVEADARDFLEPILKERMIEFDEEPERERQRMIDYFRGFGRTAMVFAVALLVLLSLISVPSETVSRPMLVGLFIVGAVIEFVVVPLLRRGRDPTAL